MSGHRMRYPQDLRDFLIAEYGKRRPKEEICRGVDARWPSYAPFTARQLSNLVQYWSAGGKRANPPKRDRATYDESPHRGHRIVPISLGGPIWSRPKRMQMS